jgi:putative spermidine/putrescine transport system substrate-binding protein
MKNQEKMMHVNITAGMLASVATMVLAVLPVTASAQDLNALIAGAKAEGQLTVIGVSHDWCGYGALIQGFKDKYGLVVNELNPNAGSGEELATIKANIGNTGPQAPDVIDVGMVFGPTAMQEELLQPYKVKTWDSIPDAVKDPEGHWYGDYYGVLAFLVNKDVAKKSPTDWSDLRDPMYKKSISVPADPRTANNAILSIYAAGLATGAKSGADAARAGIEFYRQLNEIGNLVPTFGTAAAIAKGETPITTRWDFNGIIYNENFHGNPPIETIVPKVTVAGVYAQAISKYAPHPNAAKLWMEYLYSDEGQIGFLHGLCHPIRFDQMRKAGLITDEMITQLPPSGDNVMFPSLQDLIEVGKIVAENWTTSINANAWKN